MASKSFSKKTTAQEALDGHSLAGKTAIVTGASSGLGVESTRVLALSGANVVMAVRNVAAGEEVAARLRAQLPKGSGTLHVQALDLSDLASVRAFADAYLASGRPVHILLNNAGIMGTPLGQTKQGFELQLGTNHLGHFALTTALLPALEKSAPARIVNVSSGLHTRGRADRLLATLQSDPAFTQRKYGPFNAYNDSKLANVLFTKALATRLPKGVEAFALHPGVIPTPLSRNMGLTGTLFRSIGALFMKTVEQGAATSIYAATAPALTGHSGAYLSDCREVKPSASARDAALAERVWVLSEKALGLRGGAAALVA